MNNFLEKNIKALLPYNPELCSSLISIKEAKRFEVFIDDKDSANINIIDRENFIPIYNTVPIQETVQKHTEYEKYSRYPYLYFFGIGNGVFYKMLLGNKEHRQITIIEPHVEIIYIVFHLIDFTQELNDGRLSLYNDIDFITASKLVNKNEARLYLKTYFLEPLTQYYADFKDDIVRINNSFLKAIEHSIYTLGNDAKDALLGLTHHIQNMEYMIENPSLFEFISKAKNTDTAIIVSTGPSLYKQLDLLKQIEPYVTIFCIDASFVVLNQHGIKPDIVVSLERIFNTSLFFRDEKKEYFKDIIFALTSIQHKATLASIKDGTTMISQRPFGYTMFFELLEYGYAGIGMSAANMAYELIFHSKFKQTILIGQDLAYAKDGSTHTKGHKFGQKEFKPKPNDIQVVGYGGDNMVYSTKIWILFKNFFESDIAHTKDTMLTINATEGGARIEGAVEMSFEDAIDNFVKTDQIKQTIKLKKPRAKKIEQNKNIIREKIEFILKYANKKLKEVKELFLEVASMCETIEKNNFSIEKFDEQKATKLIQKIDEIKDNFNDKTFIAIFNDVMQAWIITQELELAKIQVRDIKNEKERLLKLQDWILAHKLWLFSVAGSINANIEAIFFGLNEDKLPKSYIKKLLKYYDGDEIDYRFSKLFYGLKDRLWPYEKDGITPRIEALIQRISQTKENKEKLLDTLTKKYISKKGWEFRPDYKIAQKALCQFVDFLNDFQTLLIKKELDKNKKNILIFIKDETINIDNNIVVNSWMRKRLDEIVELISKDIFNITIAIDKPLQDDNSANGIMDDIPDIIPSYNPYVLGLMPFDKLDMFDIIITNSFKKQNLKCINYNEDHKNILYIKEFDFKDKIALYNKEDL